MLLAALSTVEPAYLAAAIDQVNRRNDGSFEKQDRLGCKNDNAFSGHFP